MPAWDNIRGVKGLGGELGHVTVDPRGLACSCGGRGCLERVAGQEALLEALGLPLRAGTALGNPARAIAELVRRALADEPGTVLALERAGAALGVALSALLNVLDLPTVILGGLYAELAPWLVATVAAELRDRVVSYSWSPVEILVSSLGADAAVRGAAGITIERILDNPVALLPDLLTKI